jgi:hypothetical protein
MRVAPDLNSFIQQILTCTATHPRDMIRVSRPLDAGCLATSGGLSDWPGIFYPLVRIVQPKIAQPKAIHGFAVDH